MANSGKQRSFVKNIIARLREIGIETELEIGKHYKLICAHDGQQEIVTISKTPSVRNIAQREALGDVRRALRNLNVDDGQLHRQGLMHLISSGDFGYEYDPEKDHLSRRMLNEGYGEEEIAITAKAVNEIERGALFGSSDVATSDLVILRPARRKDSTKQIVCAPVVAVACSEKGANYDKRYFPLRGGIESLLDYYNQCSGNVRLGIVITNVWRPFDLLEYSLDLDYFESYGIKTIFILRCGSKSYPLQAPWK